MRTPVTSLRSEDSLGKRPTTRVRFLIWPVTFSQPLVLQYLRRKAVPGLSYTAQFSATLDDFSNATNLPVVESIDTDWERVTIGDTGACSRRFGRVVITLYPP